MYVCSIYGRFVVNALYTGSQNTLIKQSLHCIHVIIFTIQYMLPIAAIILLYSDCTDIWLDSMMKSLGIRRPFTSNSNHNTAQIEELPSTFSEDG